VVFVVATQKQYLQNVNIFQFCKILNWTILCFKNRLFDKTIFHTDLLVKMYCFKNVFDIIVNCYLTRCPPLSAGSEGSAVGAVRNEKRKENKEEETKETKDNASSKKNKRRRNNRFFNSKNTGETI